MKMPSFRFSLLMALAFLPLAFAQGAQAASRCSIQAYDGHFLTAVGGGGQVQDAIHSDASRVQAWEIFEVRPFRSDRSKVALRTSGGYYVTAVGGGGRTTDVIHTDGTTPSRWEQFKLIPLGNQVYAIQTYTGHYLTAQDSGGRITDVIHSNATQIGNWEKFRIACGF